VCVPMAQKHTCCTTSGSRCSNACRSSLSGCAARYELSAASTASCTWRPMPPGLPSRPARRAEALPAKRDSVSASAKLGVCTEAEEWDTRLAARWAQEDGRVGGGGALTVRRRVTPGRSPRRSASRSTSAHPVDDTRYVCVALRARGIPRHVLLHSQAASQSHHVTIGWHRTEGQIQGCAPAVRASTATGGTGSTARAAVGDMW
jgi:hypothetical protein